MNSSADGFFSSAARLYRVDEVLEATNQRCARVRHPRADGPTPAQTSARASAESAAYVQAFWPHVVHAIESDPEHLGLSVGTSDGDNVLTADALRAAYVADPNNLLTPDEKHWRGSVLSALAVMQQVLGSATAAWAEDLTSLPRRCPLAYLVDARQFVSLRMLLPKRDEKQDRVGGNAPTLVMGGTATALTMCWNLLDQMPRAYRQLTGAELTRDQAEAIWSDTRELIYRIGGGSLAAFVALASACAENPAAMMWEHAAGLGLKHHDGHFIWTMTAALHGRYQALLETVFDEQQGHYVGCAALFARAGALPLAARWADPIDDTRDQQVFAELLRWITAAARRHLFPLLPHPQSDENHPAR